MDGAAGMGVAANFLLGRISKARDDNDNDNDDTMMPRPHQVFLLVFLLDNFAVQLLVWDPDPDTSFIMLRFTASACKRRAILLAFY